MRKQGIYSAIAGALILASGSANALVIDSFTGDYYSSSAPLSGANAGFSTSGYLRTVDATSSAASTTIRINSGASLGVFSHSQDASVTGTSQINFSLGGIDLTDGGDQNAFRIGLNSIDLNGTIGVIVDGSSLSLSTNSILIANGLLLPSFADFLFSDFLVPVDFTNVSQLSLFIDGTAQAALDAEISIIGTACSGLNSSGGSGSGTNCSPTTVAEPGTLALLGLGMAAGMMRLGRKKKVALN